MAKRDKKYYPDRMKVHPGEALFFCPVNREYISMRFQPDQRYHCPRCGWSISQEEAT